MTTQEAIENLMVIQFIVLETKLPDSEKSEYIKSISMAIEALEKQIPKKPTQADSYVKALDIENNEVVTFKCARCSCGKYIVPKRKQQILSVLWTGVRLEARVNF